MATTDPGTPAFSEIEAWIHEWELDPDTRRIYDRVKSDFRAWCLDENVDPDDDDQAGEAICGWVGDRIETGNAAAPGTLHRDLYALKHDYWARERPDPTGAAFMVLAGHERHWTTTPCRVEPLTPELIRSVLEPGAPRDPYACALWAATLVSHVGESDLGVVLDTPTAGVTIGDDTATVAVPAGHGGRRGRTRFEPVTLRLSRGMDDPLLCPVRALAELLDVAGDDDRMFAPVLDAADTRREARRQARNTVRRTGIHAGLDVDLYPFAFPTADPAALRRLEARLDADRLWFLLARAYLLVGAAGPFTGAELRDACLSDLRRAGAGWLVRVDRGVRGEVWVPITPSVDPLVCPVQALADWLIARGDAPGPLLCRTLGTRVLDDRPIDVQAGRKLLRRLAGDVAPRVGTSSLERGWLVSQAQAEETIARIVATLPAHRVETVEARVRQATLSVRPATNALRGLL